MTNYVCMYIYKTHTPTREPELSEEKTIEGINVPLQEVFKRRFIIKRNHLESTFHSQAFAFPINVKGFIIISDVCSCNFIDIKENI